MTAAGSWLVATGLLLCAFEGPSRADPGFATVEELVTADWFEGVPLERAAALGPEDGQRLAEMLGNPAERAHHAKIVKTLGACGCGPAFEALAAFDSGLDPEPDGEARSERVVRLAVPQSMGLLARRDARAIDWLEAEATRPAPDPRDRRARNRRSAVVDALSLVDSHRAEALLTTLEDAARLRGDRAMERRTAQARARRAQATR